MPLGALRPNGRGPNGVPPTAYARREKMARELRKAFGTTATSRSAAMAMALEREAVLFAVRRMPDETLAAQRVS